MATKAPAKAPKTVSPAEKKPAKRVASTTTTAKKPTGRWDENRLRQMLKGSHNLPMDGHIDELALELLRQMDRDGNYAPDALYSLLASEGILLPSTVREAVDKAVAQVRRDHGLI